MMPSLFFLCFHYPVFGRNECHADNPYVAAL